MSNEERLANNQRLVDSFRALQASESTTAEEWDTLGMEYFVAGYILNAGVCFNRADAVHAEWQKSKFVGKSAIECALEEV